MIKMEINYRHPGEFWVERLNNVEILFPDTKKKIELDIFIPQLKIAFEYHGIKFISLG